MIGRFASNALRAIADTSGSAAVEMALVTPIFMVLMFGAFDLGNYFLSEHVVVKAVRDGARFASRSFTSLPCPAPFDDTQTKNLVRTGTISGGTARLNGWTDPTTITVTVTCTAGSTATGIYTGTTTGVPIVTVRAAVPYTSLFNHFGITTTTLTLNASSQIPVMGA